MGDGCPVCELIIKTENPRYRDRKFIVLDPCPLCPEPVIIIRRHLASLTEEDKKTAQDIARELFGDNARFSNEPNHSWLHTYWHIKR